MIAVSGACSAAFWVSLLAVGITTCGGLYTGGRIGVFFFGGAAGVGVDCIKEESGKAWLDISTSGAKVTEGRLSLEPEPVLLEDVGVSFLRLLRLTDELGAGGGAISTSLGVAEGDLVRILFTVAPLGVELATGVPILERARFLVCDAVG